jgi:hypothetical protein
MEKRKIKAKGVAADVHAGMGDTELMEKYKLTAKQLDRVLGMLLDANLINDMQLWERTSLSDTQITKAFVEAEKALRELD